MTANRPAGNSWLVGTCAGRASVDRNSFPTIRCSSRAYGPQLGAVVTGCKSGGPIQFAVKFASRVTSPDANKTGAENFCAPEKLLQRLAFSVFPLGHESRMLHDVMAAWRRNVVVRFLSNPPARHRTIGNCALLPGRVRLSSCTAVQNAKVAGNL